MSSARRLYLYSASLVGLLVALASILVLSNEVIRTWSSGVSPSRALGALAGRETIGWLGLGLVGVSVWAVHWFPANGAAREVTLAGAAERASSVRKAYLYIAQLVVLGVCLAEGVLGVADVLRRALGEPPGGLAPWPGWALSRVAGALIALIFWGHLRWVTVHDGDFGRETGRAANWRRGYLYTAALVGFGLVIAGAIGYLRAMFELAGNALIAVSRARGLPVPAAGVFERDPLVWSVTALVVGIPLAITAWSTASRLAASVPDVEHGALSRVGLLHAGLLFGTAATLASAAYLLERGFLGLTGGPTGISISSWSALTLALACLPVGIVSWLAFASSARNTTTLPGEHTRAEALRRSVFYLIAGSALAVFWLGLTELLQLILVSAVTTVPAEIAQATGLQERFSLGAALVLVSAPAWWGYWWPRQTRAGESGARGIEERRSVARGLYLYSVIVSAVIVLLFSLVRFVLQAGDAPAGAGLIGPSTVGSLAMAAVALLWFVVHLLVLRGGKRWLVYESAVGKPPPNIALPSNEAGEAVTAGASSPAGARTFQREELPALASPRGPSAALAVSSLAPSGIRRAPIVVIDGGDGSLGAALLVALHSAFPEVSVLPMGLNPVAQAAMSAALGDAVPSTVPKDALSQATVILGPGDILFSGGLGGEVNPELVEALRAGSARLLLLPPRDPRLRWVAAPDWPDERWIENAAIEVGNVV